MENHFHSEVLSNPILAGAIAGMILKMNSLAAALAVAFAVALLQSARLVAVAATLTTAGPRTDLCNFNSRTVHLQIVIYALTGSSFL